MKNYKDILINNNRLLQIFLENSEKTDKENIKKFLEKFSDNITRILEGNKNGT